MSFRSLAAAITALAGFVLTAPAHAEWFEAKSKHFTVYGDMTEAALRERVQRLEKFDAALRGLFNVKTEDQATIYIVGSMDDVQRLSRSRNVLGFYRADAQGAVGVVPERLPNYVTGLTAEQVLFHEYTHHMLLSNTSQFFPAWVTEGLAELFMSAKFDENGNVIIGGPNVNRSGAMGAMSRWSVRRLIDSDANPPTQDERIELYSRGWLMCHYLLISGNRQGQFFKYIGLLNSGTRPIQAGEQVFGDLNRLNSEIERYVRAATIPSSVLSSDRIHPETNVAIRRLTEGENAILSYRITSANGVDDKTAGPLADRARPIAARYPNEVFVQRAMAEMEYDAKHYDAAEAAADRALAVDPNNVMAIAYKGRVIAQRALAAKDPALWRQARQLFLRANQANPEFALPFQLFYDSYIAAGQVPAAGAVTGIRRAVVLVPADSSLRVRAGIELIRAGELQLARTVLAPVAFDPHGTADNPYAKLVKAMDEGATKEALMTKADELKLDRINEFDPPKPDKPSDGKPAPNKSVLVASGIAR